MNLENFKASITSIFCVKRKGFILLAAMFFIIIGSLSFSSQFRKKIFPLTENSISVLYFGNLLLVSSFGDHATTGFRSTVHADPS